MTQNPVGQGLIYLECGCIVGGLNRVNIGKLCSRGKSLLQRALDADNKLTDDEKQKAKDAFYGHLGR